MRGLLALVYGVIAYVIFFASFLYAVGFVAAGGAQDGRSGVPGPLLPGLAVDLVLLGIFAVQHSVMARPGFKAEVDRMIPKTAERSTYVLLASLALILLFGLWQPLARQRVGARRGAGSPG